MKSQVDTLLLNSKSIGSLMSEAFEKKSGFKFKARGWSMYPFIKDGDILTLLPSGTKILDSGDVIGYIQKTSGKLIVHRIINKWVKKRQYLIKGDNAATDDGIIHEASILGYVDRVNRDNKIVKFGLGQEKKIIALLSRIKLLKPIGYCYKTSCCFYETIKSI